MMRILPIGFAVFATAAGAQTLGVGPETGRPLPRFESLRFDEVNLRRGAGEDYPIAWTFLRQGLPVEIFQEFELWRHVRDHDGATGWVKRTQLSPARTALVRDDMVTLHEDPAETAPVTARAEAGAVLTLKQCGKEWCEAAAQGHEGWLRKTGLWGVLLDETFGE